MTSMGMDSLVDNDLSQVLIWKEDKWTVEFIDKVIAQLNLDLKTRAVYGIDKKRLQGWINFFTLLKDRLLTGSYN